MAESNSDAPYTSFVKWERILIVFFAAMAGVISPISTQIYFPALNDIAQSLDVTIAQVNLTLTTFLIFQAISPTVVSDIADMAGRRPAYLGAYIVYVGANIGLALQNNYAALLVLRAVQSMGSSGTIALAYAMVADIATSAQRGTYMGFTGAGILLGPSVGPIFGGLIAAYLGWHAIFWALLIFSGVLLFLIVFFLPETGRNVVGNGSVPPPKWNASVISRIQQRRKLKGLSEEERARVIEEGERQKAELAAKRRLRFPNPFKAIQVIREKDIGLLLLNNSFMFASFYMVMGSLPQLLSQIYGFGTLTIGLCFIPFGVGCTIASITNGRLMDANYRRLAKKHGFPVDKRKATSLRGFPIERARLQLAIPAMYLGVMFYFAYGWMLQYQVHPAGPLVTLFFMGMFITGSFNVGNNLLVDLYPKSSAMATSANNLMRCLMGAGGTAVVNLMIAAMGCGWTFSFIAFVILISSPILFLLMKKGPKWREERYVRADEEAARKNAATPAPPLEPEEVQVPTESEKTLEAQTESGQQATHEEAGTQVHEKDVEQAAEKGEGS